MNIFYFSNKILSRALLNNIQDGIYLLDARKKIVFWNKGSEKITGFSESEVIGHQCSDNILNHVNSSGIQLCEDECPAAQTLIDGKTRSIEAYLRHKEGFRIPVDLCVMSVSISESIGDGTAIIFRDSSGKVAVPQRLKELEQMNLLDPLSKVCNQVYLKMHLQSRLEEMRKYRFPIGLLYIDVDGLDSINAKYGREAGDQMLSIIAQTLNRNIRYLDMVGRWKEEEFLAIIFNISENKLEFVADKLRLLVGRISHVSQQMVGKKHGCNEVR